MTAFNFAGISEGCGNLKKSFAVNTVAYRISAIWGVLDGRKTIITTIPPVVNHCGNPQYSHCNQRFKTKATSINANDDTQKWL